MSVIWDFFSVRQNFFYHSEVIHSIFPLLKFWKTKNKTREAVKEIDAETKPATGKIVKENKLENETDRWKKIGIDDYDRDKLVAISFHFEV